MPILAPIVQGYDTVTDVLNTVRTRVNDDLKTLLPVGGRILNNNSYFVLRALNNAWRRAQECLANKGYSRLINEVVISSFPQVASLDPASQCWLTWSGCFDGQNYFEQPALPNGFSHPLKIWERWSNQNAQFSDPPMEKCLDGLPSVAKSSAIRWWEWRNDRIYMPGSQMVEDLRIRHVSFLPDFADQGAAQWFQQPVTITRCSDGLAWLLCAELAVSRGDADAQADCTEKGEAALSRVFNLDVKADQRVNIRRRPHGGRYVSRFG